MRFVVPTRENSHSDCDGWTSDLVNRKYLAEIKHIKPSKFLQMADPNFKPKRSSIRHLIQNIRRKGCFAPLQLWPNRKRSWGMKHEGRHRAWLAHKLGIKKVPVYLWIN